MTDRSKQSGAARVRAHQHAPVWALIAVLGLASTLLWVFGVRHLEVPETSLYLPWWGIAIGFVVVESFVVNLHFRSESGSFSLLEIPLVFGLVFSKPELLWVAMIVGAVVGLAGVRRQPLLKVVFNVANLSLHVALAIVLFHLFLGDTDPLSTGGWIAMLGATTIAAILEMVAINAVISITERRFEAARAWNSLAFGWLVSAANTVQALIAALVVVVEPWGALLLFCSTTVLFVAYRAYVSERDHREQVEFLYNSTRALRESSETTTAVSALLDEATSMFRAGTAEVILFAVPESDEPAAWFGRRDGRTNTQAIDSDTEAHAVEIAEAAPVPMLVIDNSAPQVLREYLAERNIRDAMIGTLRSENRPVGVFIVGDRLGNVTTFTPEDLRLFENLIDQAAVALENDQLEQTLSKLRELEMELAYQARYDTLTGLANRSLFTSRLEEHLVRDEEALHVLYIDLDDFKLVNDTLGHSAGDALLAEVASRISDTIRPTDLAARLGGDEFAVMLVSTNDSESIGHRIIGSLSAPFQLGGDEVRIGASVGIAPRSPDESAFELLHKADLAMYAAKDRGKGSVVLYASSLQHDLTRQQALQTALRRAISEEEFDVLYQPIVRLEDLSIVGAEALVRWRQKSGRLLTPAHFIAEAERSGLITSIDRLVRGAVFAEVNRLAAAAGPDFFASINLSARHLQQPEIVDQIASDILASRANPANIVLEVTENAFVRDLAAASDVLREIRKLGVRIALDDFGTGYSSLSYLRDLPIDLLKIAQPFISDLDDTNDPTFVEAITNLSHTLGLQVVAEGIETKSALASLQVMECDLGQGFYFAKPVTADALIDMLVKNSARASAGAFEQA